MINPPHKCATQIRQAGCTPGCRAPVATYFVPEHKPDAILCTSDHLAAQLLQSLTRLALRVPQDLRLVGFDDVRFASLLTIPLTTLEQPCRDIATTAFNALRERIKKPALPPRSLTLTPRLVVRETCGAYRHQSQPIALGNPS